MLSKDVHDKAGMALLLMSPPLYVLLRYHMVAPFGKHSSGNSNPIWNRGPTMNPKFSWFLFESPNLLWSIYAYLNRNIEVFDASTANACLLSLFTIHYINRCIIYPLRMSQNSQPVNLAVLSSALAFCTLNGFLQSTQYCNFQVYPEHHHKSPAFLIGCTLWLCGFLLNLQADDILRNLRNNPPQSTYKIPHGGLFRYTSCANFCGEIMEWFGYAVASQSLPAWAFFAWVCANLIPRGISHHHWYIQKFEDYPRDRWAVIPFLV